MLFVILNMLVNSKLTLERVCRNVEAGRNVVHSFQQTPSKVSLKFANILTLVAMNI